MTFVWLLNYVRCQYERAEGQLFDSWSNQRLDSLCTASLVRKRKISRLGESSVERDGYRGGSARWFFLRSVTLEGACLQANAQMVRPWHIYDPDDCAQIPVPTTRPCSPVYDRPLVTFLDIRLFMVWVGEISSPYNILIAAAYGCLYFIFFSWIVLAAKLHETFLIYAPCSDTPLFIDSNVYLWIWFPLIFF